MDAEEVGKVVSKLQEEIKIIKLQLENLPGYEKGKLSFYLFFLTFISFFRWGARASIKLKNGVREDFL